MSTLAAFIAFAAEAAGGHSTSKTFYYVAGGGLTALALLVSFIGIKRHENWPDSKGARNGLMGLVTAVVAVAMVSAIVTS